MSFDVYYLILVVPALLLSMWAQVQVKTTFERFSKEAVARGMTGAQAAAYLLKTNNITDVGVCHNGIIPISAPDNMSDTMQYIAEKLYYYQKLQKDFYVQKSYMKRIEQEIQSKMVFLTGTGDIFKIGEFISEDDGMVYSNTSYKEKSFIPFLYDSWFDTDYFSSALLCPIEGYIQDFEGNLIDCCDDDIFLMDRYNRVYRYDYECDCAEQIYADAFTYSGLPYVFDEEQAMYFNIGV